MQRRSGAGLFPLAWLAVFLAAAMASGAETLAETERGICGGLKVLASMADLEEAKAQCERARAVAGLKVFGTVGMAFNNEPNTPGLDDKIRYNRIYGRAGLALPLVGAWARETLAKLDSEAKVAIVRQELEEATTFSLAGLRKAWITRWVEARKRALLSAYLENEATVEAALKKRMDEKLILPYQYYNVMSTYDLARMEMDRSLVLEERALAVFRMALRREIPVEDLAEPDLPIPTESIQIKDYIRHRHPEVRDLNEAAAILAQKSESAKLIDYNFRLEGSYGATKDYPGTVGDNWQFGLLFEMPIGAPTAGRKAKEAAMAAAERARLNAEIRREELVGYLSEAFRAWATGKTSQERSASQLNVSMENLRSARMRQRQFAGATFEQTLDARLIHLTVGLTALDSLGQYMEAITDVLHFAPGMDRMSPAAPRERIDARDAAQRIVRLTDARTLLVDMPTDSTAVVPAPPSASAPVAQILSVPGGSAVISLDRNQAKPLPALPSPPPQAEPSWDTPIGDITDPAKQGKQNPNVSTFNVNIPSASPKSPNTQPVPHTGRFEFGPSDTTSSDSPPSQSPEPELPTVPNAAAKRGRPWAYGVYIWDADPFLSEKRGKELDSLAKNGIRRIMLSLNAAELEQTTHNPKSLSDLLDEAHARNITVDLLLGDPEWILPENRSSLLAIVKSLSGFPFDGLHLDLEQDQLPDAQSRRSELARLTTDTFLEVAKNSPWPVGFSLHHRYLDPEGPTPWFGGRLAGIKFREAAVMAYVTNANNLIPLISRIADASPGLRITLACSIESALPAE